MGVSANQNHDLHSSFSNIAKFVRRLDHSLYVFPTARANYGVPATKTSATTYITIRLAKDTHYELVSSKLSHSEIYLFTGFLKCTDPLLDNSRIVASKLPKSSGLSQ